MNNRLIMLLGGILLLMMLLPVGQAPALITTWLTSDPAWDQAPAVVCDATGLPWLFFAQGTGTDRRLVLGCWNGGAWQWPPSPIGQDPGILAQGDLDGRDLDIARTVDGALWLLYPAAGNTGVKARRWQSGWSEEYILDASPQTTYSNLCLAPQSNGRLWAAYTRITDVSHAEPLVRFFDGANWQPGVDPTLYPPLDEPNLSHQPDRPTHVNGLAANATGELWLLLSSSQVISAIPANWDLRALRHTGNQWEPVPTAEGSQPGGISASNVYHEQGGWGRPLVADARGGFMVCWTRYPLWASLADVTREGPFDVLSRRWSPQTGWDPIEFLANSSRAELCAAMLCDGWGQVWTCWQGWCGCGGNQLNVFGAVWDRDFNYWTNAPGEYSTRWSWEPGNEVLGKGTAPSPDGTVWIFWSGERNGSADLRGGQLGARLPTPAPTDTPTTTPTPTARNTPQADLDHNGRVDAADMLIFMQSWHQHGN